MALNPDTLAKEILAAVRKNEEERIRIGLDTAKNIERLKKLGVYDKKEGNKTSMSAEEKREILKKGDLE